MSCANFLIITFNENLWLGQTWVGNNPGGFSRRELGKILQTLHPK